MNGNLTHIPKCRHPPDHDERLQGQVLGPERTQKIGSVTVTRAAKLQEGCLGLLEAAGAMRKAV